MYILDFKHNHLDIYQANNRSVTHKVIIPFDVTLLPETFISIECNQNRLNCGDMTLFIDLNWQFKAMNKDRVPAIQSVLVTLISIADKIPSIRKFYDDQRPVIINAFHRILPLICFQQTLLSTIWYVFLNMNTLKNSLKAACSIVVIVLLNWEPHISMSILTNITNIFSPKQMILLTDYVCLWLYAEHVRSSKTLEEGTYCNQYKYLFHYVQNNHQTYVYPIHDYDKDFSVKQLTLNESELISTPSPFVTGWYYLFCHEKQLQPVVFDLQFSVGLLLTDNKVSELCSTNLMYGQYMRQSIAVKHFNDTQLQVVAGLGQSLLPYFFLERLVIHSQEINQYQPIDIHMCRLNASWGHVCITQTISKINKNIIDQQFQLPRLNR